MDTPGVQAVFDLLSPSVTRCRGSQGGACPQAWTRNTPMDRWKPRRLYPRALRINMPSRGVPRSCREEMQMRHESLARRLPPFCTTSGGWTRTYPQPQWMICGKRWISNFNSLTRRCKSFGGSFGATGAGP